MARLSASLTHAVAIGDVEEVRHFCGCPSIWMCVYMYVCVHVFVYVSLSHAVAVGDVKEVRHS